MTFHSLRLDPRLIINIARAAAPLVQTTSVLVHSPRKLYVLQCELFNQALSTFTPQRDLQPIARVYANAYFWEAQHLLLTASEGRDQPLLVDRRGFDAIRKVLAGMAKDQAEAHSARRHAPGWPPYLRPADGMDEAADPEDNWSRVVKAGVLMREAGYPTEVPDEALDILQGLSPDGTPTIRQRSWPSYSCKGVWEASIRATRNAEEAWHLFQKAPDADSTPGLLEYAAMFEKLLLRDADPESGELPGDRARNHHTRLESNFTEVERARMQAPSVMELYQRMRFDDIRPQGSCLRLLLTHAESLETAHEYLQDSAEDQAVVEALTAETPQAEQLEAVPIKLFGAYMWACTRAPRGDRQLPPMKRAMEMASLRLQPSYTRWAPYIWGIVLRGLSQHRRAMELSESEHLKLMLLVGQYMEESAGGTVSATLAQLAKCVRKFIKWELPWLLKDLKANERAHENKWLSLYDTESTGSGQEGGVTESTGPEDGSPVSLLGKVVSFMKDMFWRLAERESHIQAALGNHGVPPLDQMGCRKDVVSSEHAHDYVLSLAFAGELEEMVKALRWLIEQWGRPDVVEAIRQDGEPPAQGDFWQTLCAFRYLAEPMLDVEAVESIRQRASAIGWAWPDDEVVARYAETQGSENEAIGILRQVLAWTRYWQGARQTRHWQAVPQTQTKDDEQQTRQRQAQDDDDNDERPAGSRWAGSRFISGRWTRGPNKGRRLGER
ncbi:hypothetical protein CDD83_8217 [Cordyceps sp. RAO-2017]|nr:hypothetical protein CDD83_8217 [Cordyceps sp. RAO-2017]